MWQVIAAVGLPAFSVGGALALGMYRSRRQARR